MIDQHNEYFAVHRWRLLAALLLTFIVLAGISSYTGMPYVDEAWLASPAHNILAHGHMGTSILDETSSWGKLSLQGINRHTYQVMPLYFLVQAAWYKIVGFGLFRMRALSILFGVAALLSWYLIVRKLTGDELAAVLVVALLSVDAVFLDAASLGRADLSAAAFSFSGLAVYLYLRERRFALAVFLSSSFVACGVFSHLAAGVTAIALAVLCLLYDFRRLRLIHLLLAAVPFLVLGSGWALYIMQDPESFRAQFGSNFGGRIGGTATAPSHFAEIKFRYLANFGFAPGTSSASHIRMVVLTAYMLAPFLCLLTPGIRREKGYQALVILECMVTLLVSLESTKTGFYLIHNLPWLAAMLAGWVSWAWRSRTVPRAALAASVGAIVAVQLSRAFHLYSADAFHNRFRPAAEYLRRNVAEGDTLIGTATFAFALGFDRPNLIDDLRLGYRSSKKANIIIMDDRYRRDLHNYIRTEPDMVRYVNELLARYRIVYDQPPFRIYRR